ncbi:MAG: hypothetical protein GX337_03250 [Christensenellaceae bacterium]|nr:hypothetical protein [Christensenellaceae bacterium]
MKKYLRFLSLFLIFLLGISSLPVLAGSDITPINYTYIIESAKAPEAIFLSAYNKTGTPEEIKPDPNAENPDKMNVSNTSENDSSFEWLGHRLRAQFASREYALAYEGMGISPAMGGFVMLRFVCDGIPLSKLYEHRSDIVMLDGKGEKLNNASIRVDGVVLEKEMLLNSVCYQFDAVFYLEDFLIYPSIIYVIRGDKGIVKLSVAELPDRDYCLFDESVPADKRDFVWTFEHMDGKNDAFKLLFAICEARGNIKESYATACDYAKAHDLYDEFTYLCSEVVAAKKYNTPNNELLTYLEEYLLSSKSDTEARYRAYLIQAMDIPDELLEIMDDGHAQYGYRSVLWMDSALEKFMGKDFQTFIPASPRAGVFLVTLSPDTELKPNMTFETDDGSGEHEALQYARNIVMYSLDKMFADKNHTFTGNPNIASVRIEIDMSYTSAGQYRGPGANVSAYNSECTLRAYDMLNGQLITQLTGTRSYDVTISTNQKSGKIWCAAPDITQAEGADAFVNLIFSHIPGTPTM